MNDINLINYRKDPDTNLLIISISSSHIISLFLLTLIIFIVLKNCILLQICLYLQLFLKVCFLKYTYISYFMAY